ncbi:MAG: ABC transporter ATP-binding protein [bacterium]|nr:ABC transporter ATP-binding protein [bacterium]
MLTTGNNGDWLEIDGLHLQRGGRSVLQGVDLALSGQAVGLVGVNGAGKSTLIGAMLGVLRAEQGTISILGLDIPIRARELRTRSGVMAEQAGVYPGGSGVDAVCFAGEMSGLGRRESLRRAHQALDALDVGEERYRPTKGYSTGMRQRCKLAMSLVHDPELLILDEPTVGLDPPGRLQLLNLIKDLRDGGRRILLSTHIMQDAEHLCDDLILIEAGVITFAGPVSRLVDRSSSRLIAEGSGLDAEFAATLTAAGIQVLNHTEQRIEFISHGNDDLALFWRIAGERGAELRRLGCDVVTLEDAVVDMMEADHG